MTLSEIIEQLRSCRYECEAGPLENNVAFRELVEMEQYTQDDGTTEAVETTVQYQWNPHSDITVYELALCLPYLTIVPYGIGHAYIEVLPEKARRHFNKVPPGVKVY